MGKGFLKEFQEFAIKGNMIDLAVGVIIGTAFNKIISALVNDIIMPTINFIIGGQADFSNKFIILSQPENYTGEHTVAALREAGATVLAYGSFISVFINFILLAFVVFVIVKLINKARSEFEEKQTAAPPPDPEHVVLLREIRDTLAQK